MKLFIFIWIYISSALHYGYGIYLPANVKLNLFVDSFIKKERSK